MDKADEAEHWKTLLEETPEKILITDLNTVFFENNPLQDAGYVKKQQGKILSLVVM